MPWILLCLGFWGALHSWAQPGWTIKSCGDPWAPNKEYTIGSLVAWNHTPYEAIRAGNVNTNPSNTWFWKKASLSCGLEFSRPNDPISSSSQVSSSSQMRQKIGGEPAWEIHPKRSHLCDVSLEPQADCIFPDQLDGSVIKVPKNVTRFSRGAFRLCAIEGESKPTIAVYVLDRSLSMYGGKSYKDSSAWNDPKQIADDAFRSAIQIQHSIDPHSWAAYIPFSGQIISELKIEPRSLKDSGLDPFVDGSKINDQTEFSTAGFKYGTHYTGPLIQAAKWLAQEEFKDYQKMIFFLTDGVPTTPSTDQQFTEILSAAEKGAFAEVVGSDTNWIPIPVIHSLFLGDTSRADSLQVRMGRKLVDLLAWRSGVLNNSVGTFHALQSANDIDPIMRQLIASQIRESRPTGMELLHLQTQEKIRVEQENLRADSGGFYDVVMNDNLNLVPGKNALSLSATYSDSTFQNTSYSFEVWVTDTLMNSSSSILGTPFRTQCYQSNGIFVLNRNRQSVDFLQQADSQSYLRFVMDQVPEGNADTLWIRVKNQKGDTARFAVSKGLQEAGQWIYEGPLSLRWPKAQGLFPSQSVDSLSLHWVNPIDPAESATGFQRVMWDLPKILKIRLQDSNGNAKLDRIEIHFDRKAQEIDRERITLQWQWPLRRGGRDTIDWNRLGPPQILDTNTWAWDWDDDLWAPFTGLPEDSLLRFDARLDYGPDSWRPDFVLESAILEDHMPPMLEKVLLSAGLDLEQKPDTLRFFYTENIDKARTIEPFFHDFWTRDGVLNKAHHVARERWGSRVYTVLRSPQDSSFRIQVGDSARPSSGLGMLTDLAGMTPRPTHPWVYIDGNRRQLIQVISLGKSSRDHQQEEGFLVRISDPGLQIGPEMRSEGQVGFAWGPLKVAKETEDPAQMQFPWEIWIYDQSGQFVHKGQGTIDCASPELRERCRSEDGIQAFLQWNMRSQEGRRVGTGAYPVLGKFGNQELKTRLGVYRIEP